VATREEMRASARAKILEATVTTLCTQGFAKTTARSVARSGGFAPGVIYYHFVDLDDLFIATADHTSSARLARYTEHLAGVRGAVDLVTRLRELYTEDQAGEHVAAVQELVAAAASSPRLAAQVREQNAKWQELAERLINAQLEGRVWAPLVPVRDLAAAAVGAYLGNEMLSHLDEERAGPARLFDAALLIATMIDSLDTR
jgi:AcrR family transcriptional regulator